MGIIVRQAIKGTIVSYAGVILGFINVLYLFPKFLTPGQLGIYKTLIDMVALILVISKLGSSSAGVKFFPYFNDKENKHNGFLSLLFSFNVLALIIISTLILIFKDRILEEYITNSPEFANYFYLIIPLLFIKQLITVFSTYSNSLKRTVVPKIFGEVTRRSLNSLLLVTIGIGIISFNNYLNSIVIVELLLVLGMVWYLGTQKSLWFRKPNLKIIKPIKKEIGNFLFFMILGSSSGVIVNKVDTLMIGSMVSMEGTGIYFIALSIATIIEIPKRSLSRIGSVVIADAWKNNDITLIKDIYKKSSINQMLASGLLFVLLWIGIDSLFEILPNSEVYSKGKYVVLFIALSKVIDLSLGMNAEIISFSKYYRFNVFLMFFLSFITVYLNYLMIPLYGVNGAALATFISIASYNLIRFLFLLFTYKMHPFSLLNIWIIVLIIISLFAGLLLPDVDNDYLNLIYKSIIISSFYGFIMYKFKLSVDINSLINKGLNKLNLK